MKKLIMAITALALSAGVAQAADPDGWYLSLGGGWNHAQDSNFKTGGTKDKVDYDEGWLGDVAIGHSWGQNMRTELEGSYRQNDVSKIKGPGAAGGSGNFHSWNAMLNEYYDFHNSTPWTPYIGAGIGAAFEDAHRMGNAFAANTSIDDRDTQFAYQGIVGVDYWATPQSTLGLRYDYLGTTRGKFNTDNPAIGKARGEDQNHAILATYRWQFSSAAPPVEAPKQAMSEPPVTPPPAQQYVSYPPLAPPSEAAIENSPYKIFFTNNSFRLDDTGRKVVADAAAAAQSSPTTVIRLTSNTDTTGSKKHNDRLSAERATTVREALIAQGISSDQINVVSNAERNLPVPTGNHVKEPRNRVVTIVLQ